MTKSKWFVIGFGVICVSVALFTAHQMLKTSKKVFIISPKDGAVLSAPFTVQFGLKGMTVSPAGVPKANTGHHHLLIDVDISSLNLKLPLPSRPDLHHFGKGQTQTTLDLPPGQYKLQLILGDFAHTPHTPPLISKPITVTVK